jgi:transposase
MEHSTTSPASLPAPRKARQCTADYRWTQPKVIAFLEALAQCGKVADAARTVGMSRTSAYRLRARMASARFDAAFEGARRKGIRARAAASRERLAAAARSKWAGASLAELVARERALTPPGRKVAP